jgi:hypothetical protein
MHVASRTLSCVKFTVATAFVLSTLTPSLYAAETWYQQHNLVSDQAGQADHMDSNLVNAWGLVFNPNGPVWIANNGTGTSTLYDGNGVPFPPSQPLVVNIPVSATDSSPGNPTGMVFNNNNSSENGNTPDFLITTDPMSASLFIFASESGVISAWAPTVDVTHAVVKATTPGAVCEEPRPDGRGITTIQAALVQNPPGPDVRCSAGSPPHSPQPSTQSNRPTKCHPSPNTPAAGTETSPSTACSCSL